MQKPKFMSWQNSLFVRSGKTTVTFEPMVQGTPLQTMVVQNIWSLGKSYAKHYPFFLLKNVLTLYLALFAVRFWQLGAVHILRHTNSGFS